MGPLDNEEAALKPSARQAGVRALNMSMLEGAQMSIGPNVFTITYAANGGNDIVLTAPEPSVALSVFAGMAGLAGLRRRRMRQP